MTVSRRRGGVFAERRGVPDGPGRPNPARSRRAGGGERAGGVGVADQPAEHDRRTGWAGPMVSAGGLIARDRGAVDQRVLVRDGPGPTPAAARARRPPPPRVVIAAAGRLGRFDGLADRVCTRR